MAENITGIESPSHKIAVKLGVVSTASDAAPSMRRLSAAMSLHNTDLESDFVLIVESKDIERPRAILETHPIIVVDSESSNKPLPLLQASLIDMIDLLLVKIFNYRYYCRFRNIHSHQNWFRSFLSVLVIRRVLNVVPDPVLSDLALVIRTGLPYEFILVKSV